MNRTQLEREVETSRVLLLECLKRFAEDHPLHEHLAVHLIGVGKLTPKDKQYVAHMMTLAERIEAIEEFIGTMDAESVERYCEICSAMGDRSAARMGE